MHERLVALQFYRRVNQALNSDGIRSVMVRLNQDGQLQASAVYAQEAYGDPHPSKREPGHDGK